MGRRREYGRTMRCTHDGCAERGHFVFDSRRDYDDHARRVQSWTCVRHTNPDATLSPANTRREVVLVASPSQRRPDDLSRLFWGGTNGFAHGPGFKAYASDFPPGTRLRVTAEILPPEEPSRGGRGQDMTAYALDDHRADAELPHDCEGVCDECGVPSHEIRDGLGACCRCADCGVPEAPHEYDGLRWCERHASEAGFVPRLGLVMEAAE